MPASANVGVLGRSLARCFLGELGDKTFFLTLVLAAWCPFYGVRNCPDSVLQQGLVLAGVACALAARVVMVELGGEPAWWDRYFDFLATVVLLVLGVKAKIELRYADAADCADRLSRTRAADRSTSPKPTFWTPLSYYDPDPPVAQAAVDHRSVEQGHPDKGFDYGSIADGRSSFGAPKAETMTSDVLSMVAAFVVPLLVAFSAEADDKSLAVLEEINRTLTPASALGAVVGCSLAVCVAVFAGFLFERQFSDQRLLFTVMFVCFSLALVSLSQGLQQLPALRSPGTASMIAHAKTLGAMLLQLRHRP